MSDVPNPNQSKRQKLGKAIALLIVFLLLDGLIALALYVATFWGFDPEPMVADMKNNAKPILVTAAIVAFVLVFIREDKTPGDTPGANAP